MPDIPDEMLYMMSELGTINPHGEVVVPIFIPEVTRNDGSTLSHYADTLFIPVDEFKNLSWDEIEARKTQRYENWVSAVTAQPVVAETPVPTVDEAITQAQEALSNQQVVLQQALDAVNAVANAQITQVDE